MVLCHQSFLIARRKIMTTNEGDWTRLIYCAEKRGNWMDEERDERTLSEVRWCDEQTSKHTRCKANENDWRFLWRRNENAIIRCACDVFEGNHDENDRNDLLTRKPEVELLRRKHLKQWCLQVSKSASFSMIHLHSQRTVAYSEKPFQGIASGLL